MADLITTLRHAETELHAILGQLVTIHGGTKDTSTKVLLARALRDITDLAVVLGESLGEGD